MLEHLLLVGATGDLTGRYLLPALAVLHAAGELPDGFRVTAAAAEDWDDDAFRDHASRALEEHGGETPTPSRDAVLRSLRYRQVDASDPDSVGGLVSAAVASDGSAEDPPAGSPLAVYLALPPALFTPAVNGLASVLPPGSRVALEKPFGEDEASAVALNALLARVAGAAGEEAVFRVDHVLGMAPLQNLLGFRTADGLVQRIWDGEHIEEVEILWEETLALEGRAGYYDRAGALKDVLQNHMLQVLSLVAMEPPVDAGEEAGREARAAALRSVRPLSEDDVASSTRRARYTAGRLAGTGGAADRAVPDYADEEGVDPARGTETFAEVVLRVDTPRWAGTAFRLRAGKALAQQRIGVVLHFRGPSGQGPAAPLAGEESRLWIGLDGPEDLALHLTGRAPDSDPPAPAAVTLTGAPPPSRLSAYDRVMRAVLTGDLRLSVPPDAAEAAWRVVDPVVRGWAAGRAPLLEYPAGSGGPPRLAPSR